MSQLSKDVKDKERICYDYKQVMLDFIKDNPRCDTRQLMRATQAHFGDRYSFGFFLLAGSELVSDDDIIRHTDDTYDVHPRITSDPIDIIKEEDNHREL